MGLTRRQKTPVRSLALAVADETDTMLERNFHMVQIMTACYMCAGDETVCGSCFSFDPRMSVCLLGLTRSFAHGAGDVSNAAGPLVAIWSTYTAGSVGQDVEPQLWVIVLGGIGICLGMVLFGKRVIETIGKKLTRITPSRGLLKTLAFGWFLAHTAVGSPLRLLCGAGHGDDSHDCHVYWRTNLFHALRRGQHCGHRSGELGRHQSG